MKKTELEGMRRRAEEIADATIGQGYAGTNERLFSDWAHQFALQTIELVTEVEKLRAWLRHGHAHDRFSNKRAGSLCDICKEIIEALGEELGADQHDQSSHT